MPEENLPQSIPTEGQHLELSVRPAPIEPTGLEDLPSDQRASLEKIDGKLIQQLAEGPSSLVDQAVIGMMQKLPEATWPSLKALILSPGAAWRILNALDDEQNAKAHIRSTMSESALEMSKMAGDDVKRKVFKVFIEHLDEVYASSIQTFCREQHVSVPPQDSLDYQRLLIRINAGQLALENYREHLEKQWGKFVKVKADLEGELAVAKQKGDALPALIDARRTQYSLEREKTTQIAAHISGTAGGIVGAIPGGFIGGTIVGFVEGIRVGSDIVAKWIKRRSHKNN